MAKSHQEPKIIRPDDIDPHYRWDRPLQSPGHTQVDFEERINFRRLHDYRLARIRAALSGSDLGALLSFDLHNIRYTTSTVIGEWARDKLTRYSLLTGNGDRRRLGGPHRGGGDPHADRRQDHLALPGRRAADRQPLLIPGVAVP